MVNGRQDNTRNPNRSTRIDLEPKPDKIPKLDPRKLCEAKGGIWDPLKRRCNLPPPDVPKVSPTTPEVFRDPDTDELVGFHKGDQLLLGLEPEEVRSLAKGNLERTQLPEGTAEAGTAQAQAEQAALGQQLAGQVGQVQPSTGITPTPIDYGEALTQGVVNSIPSAIRQAGQYAAGFAAAGAIGGTVVVPGVGTAVGAAGGALIGAGVGLLAGITGGMISNMKGQRTDDTNAQQRVLDEGKQTLKDWSTLAKSDPANREFYLSQFNIQLQLIQDAHVQMLTDTNADVSKFESAVPNLAEFNSFYSLGGERDALVNDMVVSLQTPVSIDYSMLELTQRRVIDNE